VELIRKDLAHRFHCAHCRRIVVVRVPLQSERGGDVPGEGLEVAYRLAALREK
jgi:hypothetical protein